MSPPGYYHNGIIAAHELGHDIYMINLYKTALIFHLKPRPFQAYSTILDIKTPGTQYKTHKVPCIGHGFIQLLTSVIMILFLQ